MGGATVSDRLGRRKALRKLLCLLSYNCMLLHNIDDTFYSDRLRWLCCYVHHRHRSDREIQRELIEDLRGGCSHLSLPLCFLVSTPPCSGTPRKQKN